MTANQTGLTPQVFPAATSTLSRTAWNALQPLPDGPLDLVGDIHGELEALRLLMSHLGFDPAGRHPAGRKLVFVGDLIDRGPDSVGAVRLVADLVARGRAAALMGNHDLNAIAEIPKPDNTWLLGHGPAKPWERPVANESERREVMQFLSTLPLALHREDLRAVHAYWDEAGLNTLAGESGPVDAYRRHKASIESSLDPGSDPIDRALSHQNLNPVKLITSGPEARATKPHLAGGKIRPEARVPWWEQYDSPRWLVFGHYWRIPVPGIQEDDGILSRYPLHATLGRGPALCIDYSVGGRWWDRSQGRADGPFTGRLAALCWPQRELVFDNGERIAVSSPSLINQRAS